MLGRRKPRHRPAAAVLARQTDVLKRIIGKRESAVALHAAGLAGEQPESGNLARRQRMLVAGDPAIEAALGRYEGPLVGRDGLGEICAVDVRRFGKRLREGPRHYGIRGQTGDDRCHRLRHLIGRFDGSRDLLLQVARTPVPEHRRRPGQIP